jgi:uridylate kinase
MGAEAIFKGTQVDGIYSADPKKVPDATRFDRLTHSQVLEKGLAVMDIAAVALARENSIPIVVFSIHEKGGFAQILTGGGYKTVVSDN